MSTCSRCRDADPNCYVCHEPLPEIKAPKFWLAFDTPISKQLKGKISPENGVLLDQINEARQVLLDNRCLMGRGAAIERRIVNLARVFMRKYRL